jgi:hypothetical protein
MASVMPLPKLAQPLSSSTQVNKPKLRWMFFIHFTIYLIIGGQSAVKSVALTRLFAVFALIVHFQSL